MTSPDRKRFYILQRDWNRLTFPSDRLEAHKYHPLYQLDLELSHPYSVVHYVIRDILNRKGDFTSEDILELRKSFTLFQTQLEDLGNVQFSQEYKLFLDKTLELLDAALVLLQ